MVKPVSFKGFQKGFQGVSLRGFRGFQIFLWELCVCIKYLSLGDPCCGTGGFLLAAYEHMRRQSKDVEKQKFLKNSAFFGADKPKAFTSHYPSSLKMNPSGIPTGSAGGLLQ